MGECMPDEDIQIGDVLQLKGPSVPVTLEGCYWRVRTVSAEGRVAADLDGPYLDAACTRRRRLTMAEAWHSARR